MTAQQLLLARLAVAAGAAGALSTAPLGGVVQAILLMVFLFVGAGSAVMCWTDVPPGAAVAAVLGISIAAIVVLATSLAWLGVWYPTPSCLGLSALVAAAGAVRMYTARAREAA